MRCLAAQSITGMWCSFGITANATAEPAGQAHQVRVFERLIRSGQRPPPHTEPARGMAHAKVRVQNNAIDAIVATAQQIPIESAQPVRHGGQVTGTLPQLQTAPGATFVAARPAKKRSTLRCSLSAFAVHGAAGASLVAAIADPGPGAKSRLRSASSSSTALGVNDRLRRRSAAALASPICRPLPIPVICRALARKICSGSRSRRRGSG